ncbi:3-oxoadipate enol-lactonase [Agrobacterium cavarae]|uniref:3-oxoadipate enol-lactonase n=1 Tax=Agrobacterium cavarae TaxID=2528239 RepID=A0ABY1YCN3_9HYPH|nr:3-oxoadipate enol-lactonase [Agrobacterium cavarae]TBN14118.1 3-oxoadipate enol-lactonase [Agrobacterium cavarae]
MNFLQVGDAAIHYRTKGLSAGKPVIAFVNSLGTDFRIWDTVIDELGDAYAYLLHDKRGHGLSSVGTPPYTIETHADDLIALLDHLKIGEVIVWGLSVGGLIAQSVAITHPERVAALVLSNTAQKIGTAEMWNARIDAVRANGLESLVDPVMERWFTPAFRRDDNPLYAGARAMLLRQSAEGYCGTCAAIRDADYTDALARLVVPTLCVAGDQDGSTPSELVESLAGLVANSYFVRVCNNGHIPPLEQPTAYAAAVADFLKALPPGDTEPLSVDRHSRGMATRRAVLGDAHVDRASAQATSFDQPFQTLITESAWGTVWSSDRWTKRERSNVTIALLAALGQYEEMAMHVRATANTGSSEDDIREALMHVAIYAGVPAANHGFKIAKQVLANRNASSPLKEQTT